MKKNKNHSADNSADEMVAFVPGSSVIDIGALKRAQNEELNDEADLIREEMDNDPELKKDVLSDFTEQDSNDDLEKIASSMDKEEKAQLKEYQKLAKKVAKDISSEMLEMNESMVAEDTLLETIVAAEAEEESIEVEEMSEEALELKAALPQMDEEGNYNLEDLQSCIEALLFYSDRPVSLKKLKDMLEMTEAEDAPFLEAIEGLKLQFAAPLHGFEVAEIAGGYQLRTKPSKAPLLRKLAKVQVQRLSRGAMETLTIVSYKQPCTKDDIDQVRGVDSSHFIRTLLDRKLIEVNGRSEAAGRPMIYTTTDIFLEVFGLMDLKALPPLHEIEAMVPQMAALEEGEEDPRVIQMRKMVHQMSTESNHLEYSSKEDELILQDIRDRVKAIDISTPYLERQKQLAAEGISGADADEILTREFNFKQATSGGEVIVTEELDSEEEIAVLADDAHLSNEVQFTEEELKQISTLSEN